MAQQSHTTTQLVRAFDPAVPLADAHTPPAAWYTDPALFAHERERVFFARWQAVACTDELARSGDVVAGRLLGEPWLLTRAADGELRGFYNVCRHHAAELVRGRDRCDTLVCPYHGWTYGLDGRLERAPGIGGVRGFERADFGLEPLAVRVWGPLVWICLAPEPPDLDAALAPLAEKLPEASWRSLERGARRSYTVAANWKVVIDNYLDGGYHVGHAHRDLAGQLDLESYETRIDEQVVVQTAAGGGSGQGADLAERIGSGAVYGWAHPAVMFNRYGPVLDVNRVVPLDVERTRIDYDWWFAADVPSDKRDAFVARSEQVQDEDTALCERVQAGLRSRSYDRGRYAPKREAAMHHFHARLHADLAGD